MFQTPNPEDAGLESAGIREMLFLKGSLFLGRVGFHSGNTERTLM
jgi:hypothetical protein